jgi:hypothetical protein
MHDNILQKNPPVILSWNAEKIVGFLGALVWAMQDDGAYI